MPADIAANLRSDEKIIYQAGLSRFLLIAHGFLGVLSLAALAFFGLVVMAYAGKFHWKFLGPLPREDFLLAVSVILGASLLLYRSAKYFYDYFQIEIVLTDKRIIGNVRRLWVPFSLQPVDLPLSDLEKVYSSFDWGNTNTASADLLLEIIFALVTGIILYLADFGTVVAVNREGRKTKFRALTAPRELANQISQAAKLGKFALPVPASLEAGGVAERAISRPVNWKLIVGWTGGALICGVAIYAYFDQEWQASRKAATAARPSASQGSAAPIKAAKGTPPDYGQLALKEKDPQQKIALYTKAIDLDPKNAEAYNNRGNAYYERQQYDLALADFSAAITHRPDYRAAYFNRGNTYSEQKEYDRAINDYSRAIALKPDYSAAYNNRGNAYFRKRDYDQALNDYLKALELNPKFAVAYANRANVLFVKKDFDRALQDYDQAIAINPDYAWAYYRRAVIYHQKGDGEQARRNYDKAKSLNPGLPELVIN
jgi:tetratricopeptide (TPR) repeat protein